MQWITGEEYSKTCHFAWLEKPNFCQFHAVKFLLNKIHLYTSKISSCIWYKSESIFKIPSKRMSTVLLNFLVNKLILKWTHLIELPIFYRTDALGLGYDCPGDSDVTLKDMSKSCCYLIIIKDNRTWILYTIVRIHCTELELIYLMGLFLAATKQLYKWYFPSVRLSVRLSVCPSVCLPVTPFWLCSHHRIIMKFSGVITNDQSKVHAKGQGQRSKVKVTEVTTQLNRFRTVTQVWIHIWWWNDGYSLMLLRRGALLFFKVICQISRSHGSRNRRIWPRLGISGL